MSTNFYAVEDEEEGRWEGIFLGKRAGGWMFQIKWHDYRWCDCGCEDETHLYRNFEEMEEWLQSEQKTIKNEYGETFTPDEFIDLVKEWNEENERKPENRDTWEIEGYHFVKGNWS